MSVETQTHILLLLHEDKDVAISDDYNCCLYICLDKDDSNISRGEGKALKTNYIHDWRMLKVYKTEK